MALWPPRALLCGHTTASRFSTGDSSSLPIRAPINRNSLNSPETEFPEIKDTTAQEMLLPEANFLGSWPKPNFRPSTSNVLASHRLALGHEKRVTFQVMYRNGEWNPRVLIRYATKADDKDCKFACIEIVNFFNIMNLNTEFVIANRSMSRLHTTRYSDMEAEGEYIVLIKPKDILVAPLLLKESENMKWIWVSVWHGETKHHLQNKIRQIMGITQDHEVLFARRQEAMKHIDPLFELLKPRLPGCEPEMLYISSKTSSYFSPPSLPSEQKAIALPEPQTKAHSDSEGLLRQYWQNVVVDHLLPADIRPRCNAPPSPSKTPTPQVRFKKFHEYHAELRGALADLAKALPDKQSLAVKLISQAVDMRRGAMYSQNLPRDVMYADVYNVLMATNKYLGVKLENLANINKTAQSRRAIVVALKQSKPRAIEALHIRDVLFAMIMDEDRGEMLKT